MGIVAWPGLWGSDDDAKDDLFPAPASPDYTCVSATYGTWREVVMFDGAVIATEGDIRRYLYENYRLADGGVVSMDMVRAAMAKHTELVYDAIKFRSYADYVGDQIAEREGWQELPEQEEPEDPEEPEAG